MSGGANSIDVSDSDPAPRLRRATNHGASVPATTPWFVGYRDSPKQRLIERLPRINVDEGPDTDRAAAESTPEVPSLTGPQPAPGGEHAAKHDVGSCPSRQRCRAGRAAVEALVNHPLRPVSADAFP